MLPYLLNINSWLWLVVGSWAECSRGIGIGIGIGNGLLFGSRSTRWAGMKEGKGFQDLLVGDLDYRMDVRTVCAVL